MAREKTVDLVERLLSAAAGPMTTGDVADRLGVVRSCADKALRTLRDRGLVRMGGGGRSAAPGHKERSWWMQKADTVQGPAK